MSNTSKLIEYANKNGILVKGLGSSQPSEDPNDQNIVFFSPSYGMKLWIKDDVLAYIKDEKLFEILDKFINMLSTISLKAK